MDASEAEKLHLQVKMGMCDLHGMWVLEAICSTPNAIQNTENYTGLTVNLYTWLKLIGV